MEAAPKKSTRKFTKIIIFGNMALVWIVIIVALATNQASSVIDPAFALIGTLFGLYVGIGHLDYRKAAQLAIESLTNRGPRP